LILVEYINLNNDKFWKSNNQILMDEHSLEIAGRMHIVSDIGTICLFVLIVLSCCHYLSAVCYFREEGWSEQSCVLCQS